MGDSARKINDPSTLTAERPKPTGRPGKWRIRTNFLILPSFQLKMIGLIVTMVLVQLALLELAIWGFAKSIADKFDAAQIPSDHLMRVFVERQISTLFKVGWGVGITLAIITAGVLLFFSHRIAGPIYKIKITLEAWLRGENRPLRLREGDFFRDVAGLLQDFKNQKESQSSSSEES